jgi:hypothetical protein
LIFTAYKFNLDLFISDHLQITIAQNIKDINGAGNTLALELGIAVDVPVKFPVKVPVETAEVRELVVKVRDLVVVEVRDLVVVKVRDVVVVEVRDVEVRDFVTVVLDLTIESVPVKLDRLNVVVVPGAGDTVREVVLGFEDVITAE